MENFCVYIVYAFVRLRAYALERAHDKIMV